MSGAVLILHSSYTMKVLQVCLAFILSTFAKGAEAPGIDYTPISDFDLRLQDVQNPLEDIIGYTKSIIESMERKLLKTERHVGLLEDKLQAYDKNNVLIEQLEKKLIASELTSKEYFFRMKMLEDRIRKSEQDQIVQIEILTRRLDNFESRLSHVDELAMELHNAEYRLSRVDEMEKKLKAVEKCINETKHKSSGDDMEEKSSSSEVIKPTNIIPKSDNEDSDNKWFKSSTDRKENERNKVHFGNESGVATDRLRGLRAPIEDRVAFRASGVSRLGGHQTGDRIIFASLDYSEGGGFDMSSGTFVCPTTGTYFFTGTIGSANKVYIDAVLKIDGMVKMSLYAGFHLQGDNMSTAVTIAHCLTGQSVWMEITNGEHLGGWEAISGFLLWSDLASS